MRPLLLGLTLLLAASLALVGHAFLVPPPAPAAAAAASACRRRVPAVAAASSPLRPLPRPRPLPLRAASGEEGGDAAGEGGKAGAAGKKRRRKVPLPAELLEAQQEQEEKVEEQKAAAPVSAAPVSAAPARSREEELAERLKQDIARFKAVEQAEAKPGAEEEVGGLAGLGQKASSALEKVLVADFFVVLAFLAWFLTGVVFKSVFDDRSVLDGFNAIWTPVIQPALGILMAGTLGVGALNQIAKGKPEQEGR